MDKDFALKISAEIGIDVQQVIREEAELIFLKALFESSLSDNLVFKGGTALRLVYESPRFSEDLDFSLIGNINIAGFEKVIAAAVRSDERFSITDLAGKYYTYIAQIRIKEPWRNTAFSLKIEISKRPMDKGDAGYINELAKSGVTNISVMTRVFSLERIMQDKLRAIKERKMPRDIFDIWYACKKAGKPFDIQGFGYPKGKIRQELRKFLPTNFYTVAENLEKLNAQGL